MHEGWAPPPTPRVLDVGCAGGRNTVWLAQQGADVWALDGSTAMVAETRRRLADELGGSEAQERVRLGEMRDLSAHADDTFDLVLALGVLQDARTYAEWEDALSEISRVLRPGGLCLVANFAPGSQPEGAPLTPVPGERNVWLGFGPAGRRMSLPDVADLDAGFARRGMLPALATAEVRVTMPRGYRITLNAL